MDYKLPPFFDCCLTFLGFSEEEKAHMEETTIEQGTTRTGGFQLKKKARVRLSIHVLPKHTYVLSGINTKSREYAASCINKFVQHKK